MTLLSVRANGAVQLARALASSRPAPCPTPRRPAAWKGLKVRDDQAGLSGSMAAAPSFAPEHGPVHRQSLFGTSHGPVADGGREANPPQQIHIKYWKFLCQDRNSQASFGEHYAKGSRIAQHPVLLCPRLPTPEFPLKEQTKKTCDIGRIQACLFPIPSNTLAPPNPASRDISSTQKNKTKKNHVISPVHICWHVASPSIPPLVVAV